MPAWAALQVILDDVHKERQRQERLKREGRFDNGASDDAMTDAGCLAVLVEEVGEVARALLERERLSNDVHGKNVRDELIQVAAVACAWVERLDREGPRVIQRRPSK